MPRGAVGGSGATAPRDAQPAPGGDPKGAQQPPQETPKQRAQRNKRRERAQRMQAQKAQKNALQPPGGDSAAIKSGAPKNVAAKAAALLVDSGEEDEATVKPPRPPPPSRRKKGNKEQLYEEDVVDGFAILSFRTYDDLQPTHLCLDVLHGLGDNNTLREVTTPNPEATNNTDETAPRERDAGSITSANFDT
ncbi:hypothetical protein LSTR_LSTR014732 [Laodelphax striatellus]|uniref:Uncharacterized protein n=2 Tax=Laodelphax striatellus TaxID=195883 RepID=A0A482WJH9_LAOST|nr:hypothetical protein LSTR_LSTR014732 [Laodelphax striatellus]